MTNKNSKSANIYVYIYIYRRYRVREPEQNKHTESSAETNKLYRNHRETIVAEKIHTHTYVRT